MAFQDQTLACQGCGQPFVFTAGEQEFYEKKGFRETPRRCRPCRDARKAGGSASPAAPRREEARPRPRAATSPPVGPPRSSLGQMARIAGGEEALRRAVGPEATAEAPLDAPTPSPEPASTPGRRGAPVDDDIGNRWSGGPARRFGLASSADDVDDDIGNRIDVEPGRGMSRGVREQFAAAARPSGPVELPCVACGQIVRVQAPPPPGRPVFCLGCQ